MYAYTDKKFIGVGMFKVKSELYEYIVADVKRHGDPNYKIYSIRGMFDFSNPEDCLKKQRSIVKDLSLIFKNKKKREWDRPSAIDSTGQSKVIGVTFDFEDSGNVSVICYDYAEHINRPSGLDVTIRNRDIQKWLEKY